MDDETAAQILVVDDTPANLKLLASLLTDHGYQVRPALSGEMALRSLAIRPPDLILLDVRMPGLDGYEVCRRLKSEPQTQGIPVIFISASSESADKVQGFAAGGVDYIAKPFAPEEVLARVKTHLELRYLQQGLEKQVEARTSELVRTHRALQESEERLRLVIEATSDGIWDWDLRHGGMFFSDRWYTMLDYNPGEFAAGYDGWRERVHPDDLAAAERSVQRHLDGELPELDIEVRMLAKNGHWKWINSRGKAIGRDEAGRPLRLVGTNVDITQRKQSEKALRLAQLSIMKSADAVFWIKPDGRFVNVNEQACRSLGYRHDELLGLSVWDIDPDFTPDRWRGYWEKVRHQEVTHLESRHQRRDGTIFPVEITVSRVEHDGEEYNFAFVRDITDRKQAQEKLRESLARFTSFAEATEYGFGMADLAYRIRYVNAALGRMLGESDPRNVVERHFLEYFPPEVAERLDKQILPLLMSNGHWQGELTLLGRDGKTTPIEANLFVIRDAHGHTLGFGDILTDISARKRADEALRESEARVRTKLHSLLAPEGDIGTLELADIIDVPAIQATMDELYKLTGMGVGIVDLQGRVLIDTGVRKVSADFQRANPRTGGNRLAGDIGLSAEQECPSFQAYRRQNHIYDVATPIVVGGRHLGNLVLAQFFFADDPPDREVFRAQARQHGFAEDAYLAELDQIPRWSREQVGTAMRYYARFADLFSSQSYSNIKLARSVAERDALLDSLKASEARLQENGEFLSTLLDAIPAPVFYKDTAGRYLGCNQAFEELIGQSRGDVIGKNTFDVLSDDQAEIYRARDLEVLRQSLLQAYEARITDSRGAVHDVVFHKAMFTDSAGQVRGFIGVILDITARKSAEEALRVSEAFYRSVFENSLVGIGISGPDMKLIQVNPAFCRMLEYDSDEIIDKMGVGDVTHPDDVPSSREAIGRLVRRETEQLILEKRYVCKSGRIIDAIAWVKAIYDSGGEYVGSSASILDITERKLAEEELQRHRAHLEELVAERTAELRQAMDHLVQSEKLAALGHLVAGVAHELNTPLGNTRTMASALGDYLQEFVAAVDSGALRRSQMATFLERCREAVELLERNTVRAAELISHFKQVAVDQTSVRRRRFFLRQTVEETLATLQPLLKRSAHHIELLIADDLEMDSYPGPLEQVLVNLINNSLTHGFAGDVAGVIRIKAMAPDAAHVRIDYTDDGVGIPESLHTRIFEPFFTTRLGSGGSGLGLYIVYSLVTGVLGGTIKVFSPADHGAAFSLTLPRRAADQPNLGLVS